MDLPEKGRIEGQRHRDGAGKGLAGGWHQHWTARRLALLSGEEAITCHLPRACSSPSGPLYSCSSGGKSSGGGCPSPSTSAASVSSMSSRLRAASSSRRARTLEGDGGRGSTLKQETRKQEEIGVRQEGKGGSQPKPGPSHLLLSCFVMGLDRFPVLRLREDPLGVQIICGLKPPVDLIPHQRCRNQIVDLQLRNVRGERTQATRCEAGEASRGGRGVATTEEWQDQQRKEVNPPPVAGAWGQGQTGKGQGRVNVMEESVNQGREVEGEGTSAGGGVGMGFHGRGKAKRRLHDCLVDGRQKGGGEETAEWQGEGANGDAWEGGLRKGKPASEEMKRRKAWRETRGDGWPWRHQNTKKADVELRGDVVEVRPAKKDPSKYSRLVVAQPGDRLRLSGRCVGVNQDSLDLGPRPGNIRCGGTRGEGVGGEKIAAEDLRPASLIKDPRPPPCPAIRLRFNDPGAKGRGGTRTRQQAAAPGFEAVVWAKAVKEDDAKEGTVGVSKEAAVIGPLCRLAEARHPHWLRLEEVRVAAKKF